MQQIIPEVVLSTPESVRLVGDRVDEIIKEIERNINRGYSSPTRRHRFEDSYVNVNLGSEYSQRDRKIVAQKYVDAGWERVTHSTSSENGREDTSVTYFTFYANVSKPKKIPLCSPR